MVGQAEISPDGPRINGAFEGTPGMIVALWVIGIIFWIVCLLVYFRQRAQFRQVPFSFLRECYLTIIAFPLVISTLSIACMVSVRPAFLWELAQKVYESLTLYAFFMGLMVLLGHDPQKVTTLLKQGPATSWCTAPPCCCWFRFCVPASHMNVSVLEFIRFLVVQYVWVVPIMGFLQLWMLIDGWKTSIVPSLIVIGAMLICFQGLFMLYRASHETLTRYRPTTKFVTIKLIVIIAALQKFVINYIVPDDAQIKDWDSHALAALWNAFLLSVEAPLFALAIYYAFPAIELSRYQSETALKVDQDGRIELQSGTAGYEE